VFFCSRQKYLTVYARQVGNLTYDITLPEQSYTFLIFCSVVEIMEDDIKKAAAILRELSPRIETATDAEIDTLLEAFRTVRKQCTGGKELQVSLVPLQIPNVLIRSFR